MNVLTVNNTQFIIERCGLIPYCQVGNNKFKILLGLKSNYGKFYGDLGGGITRKETFLDGLVREVFEESSTLIFKDKDDILNRLPTSAMILYQTKNPKYAYIQYLVEVHYSTDYITRFLDHKITEHLEFRWFDVEDGVILNFDIKTQLDGSIKPLIEAVLSLLHDHLEDIILPPRNDPHDMKLRAELDHELDEYMSKRM